MHGYRKRGAHTRVFSQTLAHGNRKNEICDKETEQEIKKKGVSMEISKAGVHEKRSPTAFHHQIQ